MTPKRNSGLRVRPIPETSIVDGMRHGECRSEWRQRVHRSVSLDLFYEFWLHTFAGKYPKFAGVGTGKALAGAGVSVTTVTPESLAFRRISWMTHQSWLAVLQNQNFFQPGVQVLSRMQSRICP